MSKFRSLIGTVTLWGYICPLNRTVSPNDNVRKTSNRTQFTQTKYQYSTKISKLQKMWMHVCINHGYILKLHKVSIFNSLNKTPIFDMTRKATKQQWKKTLKQFEENQYSMSSGIDKHWSLSDVRVIDTTYPIC